MTHLLTRLLLILGAAAGLAGIVAEILGHGWGQELGAAGVTATLLGVVLTVLMPGPGPHTGADGR